MRNTAEEIAALIARVALEDRSAFRRLYERTSPKLFGVCLRILRDRPGAEEALQEVYVKVWQRASRYTQSDFSPISWLVAVARNHCLDIVRARKPLGVELESALEVATSDPSPEDSAISMGERARIERCLDTLEHDRAEAVRGAYLDGFSYEELAARHDVPLNTMRTWLRRSLIRLRECLTA